MIALTKVGFSYGPKNILESVDLSIDREDRIALVGPSGCGKSTLLELILGYKKPTSGLVSYDHPHLSFGVSFQQNDLLPWMTVLSQVTMGLCFQNKKKMPEEAVFVLLEKLGLLGLEKHQPSQLSGGQQKRVSLARALAQKPDLLLLDEPFVGVDQLSCELIYRDLKKLVIEEKQSLVLVTHHIQEAVYLAKKIAIFSGTPGRLTAILENPFFEEEDVGALSLASFAKTVRSFL